MKRIKVLVKFLIIFSISIIFILAIATSLFIYFFPKDKLLVIIKETAEKKLHQKVNIAQINYSLSGVTLSKIIISDSNNNFNNEKNFLTAEKVNLKFSLSSLLEKKLFIKHIKIFNPILNISYTDNKYNYEDILKVKNEKTLDKNESEEKKENNKTGIKTTISSLTIENAQINLLSCHKKITPLIGNYNLNLKIKFINKNHYNIPDIELVLPKNRGEINGNLNVEKKNFNYQINGNLKLKELLLSWTNQFNKSSSHPAIKINGELKNINANKNRASFNIDCKLLLTNKSHLLTNGHILISLNPFNLLLNNLKVHLNKSTFTIKNLKYQKNPKILNFKLYNIDLDINDIKSYSSKIPKKLYGKYKGQISLNNDKINAVLEVLNGGYNKKFISGINGKVVIENNNFKIEKLPVKYYNQNAIISIASIDNSYKNLIANIYIKEFILLEYLKKEKKEKTNTKSKNSHEKINIPVNIKGRINIGKFKIREFEFENIFLSYILFNSKLNIARLKTSFLNTDFIGNGNVDFNRTNPYFNFNVSFHDFKVQKLAKYSKNKKARFFGIANGKVNINFYLRNKNNFLEAINSKIQFQINKGKMVDTGIQNGLGIWLSPLKHKLKDLEFNRIYGNIYKNNIDYTINSFVFN